MLLAAIPLALLVSGPGRAAEEEFPTELRAISSIKLEGRRHVPAREIWAALKTKRPSVLPWREKPRLRLDFLRSDTSSIAGVYREHGYLDAHATFVIVPAKSGNRAAIRFRIIEGRQARIASVDWTGIHAFRFDPLRGKLLARAGRAFNPAYMIADTVRIARYYQDRGYLPRVDAGFNRDSLDRIHVHYAITEGPHYRFGRTYLSSPGDLHVKEHLVRRELLVKENQPFQMTRVERSIEHLYDTGLFSQVQMSLLPDTSRKVVEFDLRVRERKKRWFDAGIGSGTTERFRFTGEWGHRNLTGHGQQGVVDGRLAFDGHTPNPRYILGHIEASLLEPWLFRTRTRGQVTGYYEERNDFTVPQWDIYQIARGFTFQLRREYGRYTLATLSQDNAYITQAVTFHPDTTTVHGVPLLTDARRDSLKAETPSGYTTHRLELNIQRDSRDNPLNPTQGSFANVVADVAGGPLKGTSSFTKLQGLLAWYSPTKKGWIVAIRGRGGVIDPFGSAKTFTPPDSTLDPRVARVPLEDRFRVGGVNSIRGFSENSIPATGGLALLEANLEVRVPVVGPFGFEAYIDGGNVWTRPSSIRRADFLPRVSSDPLKNEDIRWVVGIGPRLTLPIGPLRLDYTWSLRPTVSSGRLRGVAQFAIGPSF